MNAWDILKGNFGVQTFLTGFQLSQLVTVARNSGIVICLLLIVLNLGLMAFTRNSEFLKERKQEVMHKASVVLWMLSALFLFNTLVYMLDSFFFT